MFVGLLGGSFNPIHNGHLHIATSVYRTMALDRVLFIPTGDPPHKPASSLAPAHHRVAMVKLATEATEHFIVDDQEAFSPQVSYSIDTVTRLQQTFPANTKLGFIIGLDAFLEFESWKQATDLLEICQMIVCSRPQTAFVQLRTLSILPPIPESSLQALDENTQERLDITLPSGGSMTLLSFTPCDVSATEIRNQAAHKQPIGHWLPPSVESYIIRHQVYL